MEIQKIKFTFEQRKEFLRDITLMDDDFMSAYFNNNIRCVQAVINCLIPGKKLTVTKVETQKTFSGIGRSITIDVFAVDSEGRLYDIEIQRSKKGASVKRASFHADMMTVQNFEKGKNFDEIPECYIIFITEHDTFGFGDVVYELETTIKGRNIKVEDGRHIIYLNCASQDDGSDAWKLAHDMKCANPDKMMIPELAESMRFYKEEEKGAITMTKTLREKFLAFYRPYIEAEAKKAEKRGIIQSIEKLIASGKMTLEDIASTMDISLHKVKAIAKSMKQ